MFIALFILILSLQEGKEKIWIRNWQEISEKKKEYDWTGQWTWMMEKNNLKGEK